MRVFVLCSGMCPVTVLLQHFPPVVKFLKGSKTPLSRVALLFASQTRLVTLILLYVTVTFALLTVGSEPIILKVMPELTPTPARYEFDNTTVHSRMQIDLRQLDLLRASTNGTSHTSHFRNSFRYNRLPHPE